MFTRKKMLDHGFTVVEMIVVITVLSILSVVVLGTLGNYYQDSLISLGNTTQDTDARSTLLTIGEDMTGSSGFLGSLSVSAPLAYYNNAGTMTNQTSGWSYAGLGVANTPNSRVLMVKKYATDIDPADSNRQPLFVQVSGSCDPLDSRIVPAEVTYIYFISKDSNSPPPPNEQFNLYRRTVLPAASTVYCRGGIQYTGNNGKPWQKQTCASGTTTTLDPSGLCQARDALLLRGITAFRVGYYGSPNDTTARANPVDGDSAVQLTVEISRLTEGKLLTNTATIRSSRY